VKKRSFSAETPINSRILEKYQTKKKKNQRLGFRAGVNFRRLHVNLCEWVLNAVVVGIEKKNLFFKP